MTTKKTQWNDMGQNQSDRFTDLARELECDDDESRWDEKLRKIAKAPKSEEKAGQKRDDSE